MNKKGIKTVGIVGLGYVGLPLALLVKKRGYRVYGIVKTLHRANLINNGESPFENKEISRNLKKYPITTSTSFKSVSECEIVVICVPTPVNDDYCPDYEPLISSSTQVGKNLKKGQLIILESTVNPGAIKEVVIPILEKMSNLKAGKDFDVSHCPERINPGDKKWNVENIPRVVGSLTKIGLKKSVEFYRSILIGEVKAMNSIEEAEAVKIVENCFRDVNIALVNELAMSFGHMGIDIKNVLDGASTKPYGFMRHNPSCGVGGHCIPVDPYYLIEHAKKRGFDHKLLSLARKINNGMPQYVVKIIKHALKRKGISLKDAKVTILGLAYKANIDDCRESPSFVIIDELKKIGIEPRVFDPHVKNESTFSSLNKALNGVHAVIIATDHKEFTKLTQKYLKRCGVSILVDGKNCLEKNKFLNKDIGYYGIGR